MLNGLKVYSYRRNPLLVSHDTQISLDDFQSFIASEVHMGTDIITSPIKLPSGLNLPLGQMIKILRRKKVIVGIEMVGAGSGVK